METLVGKTVKGRYFIKEILGEGGMGKVYKAYDQKGRKYVAIKSIKPHFIGSLEGIERFLREAKVQMRLAHPHIVEVYKIFDYRDSQGNLYFMYVMELLEGKNLRDYLKENHPLPLYKIIEIFSAILEALHYTHKHNIIHRDLNFGNIIVMENGKHKLIDFGIAKNLDDLSITHTQSFLGTPYFGAPEMIYNPRNATPLSDIYSIGVLMYYAVENKIPFGGHSPYEVQKNIVSKELPPVRRFPELSAIIAKATHKDPRERYQSALEFLQALHSVLPKPKRYVSSSVSAQKEKQSSLQGAVIWLAYIAILGFVALILFILLY